MKNKKKLLLGVAAMGLVAVATGAVSTVAWYQTTASAEARVGTAAMVGTATGSIGSVGSDTLYAKFSITPQNDGVKLTTTDGYCYNIVSGYIRDAQEGTLATRYGSATVAFLGWYTNEACTSEASASQKAAIAADTAVTLYVGGYDNDGNANGVQTRLRTSLTAPTVDAAGTSTDGSIGKLFGTTLGNRVAITATFVQGGASCTFSNSGTVYYVISGSASLQTKAEMDALVAANTPAASVDDDGNTVGGLAEGLRKLQIYNANL